MNSTNRFLFPVIWILITALRMMQELQQKEFSDSEVESMEAQMEDGLV